MEVQEVIQAKTMEKCVRCYTSYCMRFHIVIFITLMEICGCYLGALDRLGRIHLCGAPSLHCIGSFDGCLWLGESHFFLAWMIVLADLVVFLHVLALLITPWLHISRYLGVCYLIMVLFWYTWLS
jgi:hypothetical protein